MNSCYDITLNREGQRIAVQAQIATRGWVYDKRRKAWCLLYDLFVVHAAIRRRQRGWYLAVEPNLHTVYVFPTLEGAMLAAELIL